MSRENIYRRRKDKPVRHEENQLLIRMSVVFSLWFSSTACRLRISRVNIIWQAVVSRRAEKLIVPKAAW